MRVFVSVFGVIWSVVTLRKLRNGYRGPNRPAADGSVRRATKAWVLDAPHSR